MQTPKPPSRKRKSTNDNSGNDEMTPLPPQASALSESSSSSSSHLTPGAPASSSVNASSSQAISSSSSSTSSEIQSFFLDLASKHPTGLRTAVLQASLPSHITLASLEPVINSLLASGQLRLFVEPNTNQTIYRILNKDEINKYKTLTANEQAIYEFIRSRGRNGAWTKDIRKVCGLSNIELTKLMKNLLSKQYIKDHKSIEGGKKMYLCAEFEPSQQITGNNFYTDGKLDSVLIEGLNRTILNFMQSQSLKFQKEKGNHGKMIFTVEPIADFINSTGAFTSQFSNEEIGSLLRVLVWDGCLQVVRDARLVLGDYDDDDDMDLDDSPKKSKITRKKSGASEKLPPKKGRASSKPTKEKIQNSEKERLFSHLKHKWSEDDDVTTLRVCFIRNSAEGSNNVACIPCMSCPVASKCYEGLINPISPQNCEYLKTWIEYF